MAYLKEIIRLLADVLVLTREAHSFCGVIAAEVLEEVDSGRCIVPLFKAVTHWFF